MLTGWTARQELGSVDAAEDLLNRLDLTALPKISHSVELIGMMMTISNLLGVQPITLTTLIPNPVHGALIAAMARPLLIFSP